MLDLQQVQEGFEGGIYTLDEAKRRIADHQAAIATGQSEIQRLQENVRPSTYGKAYIDAMREELKAIRARNLDEATFEEKLEIVSKLGIKVYPSEDLKSMRVVCQLNLERVQSAGGGKIEDDMYLINSEADRECESATGCRKVHLGPPKGTKGKTFEKTFALMYYSELMSRPQQIGRAMYPAYSTSGARQPTNR